MTVAKRRLRNLSISEVSFVGAGDNPPARVVLYKARPDHPAGPTRTHEEEPTVKTAEQILAGLPEAERAIVQKHLDALAPKTPPDPMEGVPEAIRKQLADERERSEKMQKELTELRTDREREAFAKTLTITALPVTVADACDLLFEVPVEKRTKLVALLKAADEAVHRSGLLQAVGSDRMSAEGSAIAKADALAAEIRKAHPHLSPERARTRVFEQDPTLYAQYEREQRAAIDAHRRGAH